MFARFVGALFAPKYPKFYTGRHRAPARFRVGVPRIPRVQPERPTAELA